MTPAEIVTKLRRNGGPLATAAADCIESLLKTPRPQPQAPLDPRRIRLIHLFQKKILTTQRDPREETAWRRIAKHVAEADLDALERFYRLPQSEKTDATWSRKRNLITLLNNYVGQVELAHSHLSTLHTPRSTQSIIPPEPEGWQAHAPGDTGRHPWPHFYRFYREEAETILRRQAQKTAH